MGGGGGGGGATARGGGGAKAHWGRLWVPNMYIILATIGSAISIYYLGLKTYPSSTTIERVRRMGTSKSKNMLNYLGSTRGNGGHPILRGDPVHNPRGRIIL